MRRLAIVPTLGLTLGLLSRAAWADGELPGETPTARVSQQVGLTEIALEYGSPAVQGRRVWGGLVPYDRPWAISTGAPSTIHFSREVNFAGKVVPAGLYRLSVTPGKGAAAWVVTLTRQGDAGTPRVSPGAAPAPAPVPTLPTSPISVRVPARPSAHRERLTFFFADFTDDRATLDLEWEKVRVSVPIAVNTAQQIAAEVGALEGAWRSYANAARYMLETKKDFDAGLKYANQSLALKEDYYTLWIKAALLAAKGDYGAATQAGQRSYALGQKLGDGFVLEGELRRSLALWSQRP